MKPRAVRDTTSTKRGRILSRLPTVVSLLARGSPRSSPRRRLPRSWYVLHHHDCRSQSPSLWPLRLLLCQSPFSLLLLLRLSQSSLLHLLIRHHRQFLTILLRSSLSTLTPQSSLSNPTRATEARAAVGAGATAGWTAERERSTLNERRSFLFVCPYHTLSGLSQNMRRSAMWRDLGGLSPDHAIMKGTEKLLSRTVTGDNI